MESQKININDCLTNSITLKVKGVKRAIFRMMILKIGCWVINNSGVVKGIEMTFDNEQE